MSVMHTRKASPKMLYLIEQYLNAHPDNDGVIEPRLVAAWLVQQGLWKRPPVQPEEILRKEISRALGNDTFTDPKGREIRKNHAILVPTMTPNGIKRLSRWYSIYDAPPKHMRTSLSLRRRAAVADVFQLKLDFDSYNDFNNHGAKLDDLDFNLNKDIDELLASGEWPEGPEDDEDDDPII